MRQVGRFTRVAMEKRGGVDTTQKYTGSQEFMVKDHEFVLVLNSMVGRLPTVLSGTDVGSEKGDRYAALGLKFTREQCI